MLNLYLLRHAKSNWAKPLAADFARKLTARGRRAARRMADHMAAQGLCPTLILCSPARRTRETLAALATDANAEILFEDTLYAGSAGDYLALITAHGGKANEVLVIGHNPAIEELALLLAGGGDKTALAELAEKFPTAALAHIAFEVDDRFKLTARSGRLVAFERPRELGTGDERKNS